MTTNNFCQSTRALLILITCLFLAGCGGVHKISKTPRPSVYGDIEQTEVNNGYPKQRLPWIVYSDREKNRVNPTRDDNYGDDGSTPYKEAGLLKPLLVLSHKGNMLKTVEYSQELLNNGTKSFKNKSLKIYGWLPEDRLLLWNNSPKDFQTGFTMKAALVVNDSDILINTDKYIEHDSVIVYNSPYLIDKTNIRLALGRMVYIYKLSEDKERYLIGDAPGVMADSVKNHIFGWVSKNIVSLWGERAAIRLNETDSVHSDIFFAEKNTNSIADAAVISSDHLQFRSGFENIFPLQVPSDTGFIAQSKAIKFFTNAMDYDKNKIYNVLGNPVYYQRYKEILSDNKKLNIVFVLDMSRNNMLYIPTVKSLLQQLQLRFTASAYFSSVKFGSVVYKQNPCNATVFSSPLSRNYKDIASFFEQKIQEMQCRDQDIVQPVGEGLSMAAKMLSGVKNETNIIILIGTTAGPNQTQAAINALTSVRARAIIFQTQSGSEDAYNDFVLLARNAVINSAANITELKKEKIVNPQDLLLNNSYDLAQGANGVYSLNFPQKSMTEGFVIFPNKGEVMPANVLNTAIDSLLAQVTKDNRGIDSTLTTYFRSDIGVSNTTLSRPYQALLGFSYKPVPTPVASGLFDQNTSFLFPGYLSDEYNPFDIGVENGILLNEQEYDLLKDYYNRIYKKVLSSEIFDRRQAVRKFVRFVSQNNPTTNKIRKATLYHKTMNQVIEIMTGYSPVKQDSLNHFTLKEWKKNEKHISNNKVYEFFDKYRVIAEKLATEKNSDALRFYYKGQYYYWLTQDYIPIVK